MNAHKAKIFPLAVVFAFLSMSSFAESDSLLRKLSCDTNSFYVHAGYIHKLFINGTTITDIGIIDSFNVGGGLAICNNLNGGSVSPTFYEEACYFDGTSWPTFNSTININGIGGNGDYLYYLTTDDIKRYDGSGFTPVYSPVLPATHFGVADIAVDDSGNIYCFTTSLFDSSEYIDVVSPAGQLIKRYNFLMPADYAYGCFLQNEILYVGFGPASHAYNFRLLPISFTQDSAIAGTPMLMPLMGIDLASCKPGIPSAISILKSSSAISCFPNPATDVVKIICPDNKLPDVVRVFDYYGRRLLETFHSGSFSLKDFVPGYYLVEIQLGSCVVIKHIIKI